MAIIPGIAKRIFDAFKLGRAAIVAGAYDVRDAQANILKIQLSKVIGYKSVDYLEGYMSKMAAGNTAGAFHALSEDMDLLWAYSSLMMETMPHTLLKPKLMRCCQNFLIFGMLTTQT